MPNRPIVTVGIAVVEHAGRYLVGVRGADGPLPGKAEFPGGKCGSGEEPRDCVLRECREETGLDVAAVECLLQREFDYDHAHVDLHFWLCRPADPQAVAEVHRGFRWVAGSDLRLLEFPEANGPVIERLCPLED